MIKLLHAGFFRYLHSTVFKVCAASTVLLGSLFAWRISRAVEFNEYCFFFETAVFAILISVSVGTETSRCIRQKIVCGYRKTTVFFSELILATVMVSLFLGVFLVLSFALNLHILGHIPFKLAFQCIMGFYCLTISLGAGLAALSSIFSHKVVSVVVCLIFLMSLYMVNNIVVNVLSEKEFLQYGMLDHVTGEMIRYEEENPKYIHEPWRSILVTFGRINPYGQRAEYGELLHPFLFDDEHWEAAKEATANTIGNDFLKREISEDEQRFLNTAPLYSLLPTLGTVPVCWLIFRRKTFR